GTLSGAASLFESQLQIALPLGEVLTPYAGAGAGLAKMDGVGEQADEVQAVFSGAIGVKAAFSDHLGLVADARIRGRGSQLASHMDVTVGLRYAFGRPDRPRFRGPRR
ncbi:MAG TPA: outer membrane beta-barrel protein, partial [Longimicrobium sp.]|nr:outer membrane beta-barrel protein [Longimicrobium sp.]